MLHHFRESPDKEEHEPGKRRTRRAARQSDGSGERGCKSEERMDKVNPKIGRVHRVGLAGDALFDGLCRWIPRMEENEP